MGLGLLALRDNLYLYQSWYKCVIYDSASKEYCTYPRVSVISKSVAPRGMVWEGLGLFSRISLQDRIADLTDTRERSQSQLTINFNNNPNKNFYKTQE